MVFHGERPGAGLGGGAGAPATTWRAEMTNRERRIREIAYHLWEQEGRPEGESDSHRLWLAAEAQYQAEVTEEGHRSEKTPEAEPPAEAAVEPPAEPVPAVKKSVRPVKSKTDEPAAEKPARSAKPKAAEPAPQKRQGPQRRRPPSPRRKNRQDPANGSRARNSGSLPWRRVRSGKAI